MTHYDTLGVARDASPEEIRRAFRSQSMKWHPDKNPAPEAKEKFQELNAAYEILSDEERRAFYDAELRGGGGPPQGFPFGGGGPPPGFPHDIFAQFFGGGMGPHGMGGFPAGAEIHIMRNGVPFSFRAGGGGPPVPIVKNVSLPLQKAFTGGQIAVPIERWIIHDNKKETQTETLNIDIPAGISSDEILVLRDKGNINNGQVGEVKLCFKIEEHPLFRRDGLDLVMNKTISLKEALCGFTAEIPHLNGKTIVLREDKQIIRPREVKVLAGMGMRREGQTGNLRICFDVVFPSTLTEDQKETLRRVL